MTGRRRALRLLAAIGARGVVDAGTADHLVRLYGADAAEVADLAATDPALAARVSEQPGRRDLLAQAVYAVSAEGARTLAGSSSTAGVRVLASDGILYLRRSSTWVQSATGVSVLAVQQGAPDAG